MQNILQINKINKTDKTDKFNPEIKKRLLSAFLAIVMIFGSAALIPLQVFAAAVEEEEEDEVIAIQDYTTLVYANIDEKLATFGKWDVETEVGTGKNMTIEYSPNGKPVLVKDGYELYYHYETGEVAVKDTRTGQVLMSNPYDVYDSGGSADTAQKLMSQVLIRYQDADKELFFNTYKDSAMNRQIKMKPIKGGIRVEYTIGKEEKRKLVPRVIEKASFDEHIKQHITNEREHAKLMAYYTLKDLEAPDLTERAKKELQVTYPHTKYSAIYVFDPNASARELTQIEGYIKTYTAYTFEMMDADHQIVEYEAKDKAPPLFKMALEYYIDKDGLYVRMPANGIRFDESTYKLSYLNVLPYMGAGSRGNTGYTFIPDGSGALVRYEDIGATQFMFKNKIYGQDFSFRKVSKNSHTQDWRLPVFGAVENYTITREFLEIEEEIIPEHEVEDEQGNITVVPEEIIEHENKRTETEDRFDGFFVIIEEGDSMAEIATAHEGSLHKYNSVSAYFTPRPTDEYHLDYNTTGLNSLITVASRRKYAGNYILRYIMLSSDENGNPKVPGGYEASYVGMAKAYRNYLIERGQLQQLEDTGEDIPLYLETLGVIRTPEYLFGFPYIGHTPLTTFEDIKTMIDDLNAEGITNLNFRLLGWINDGMKMMKGPGKISIQRQMGGKNGFQNMVDYAKSKNVNIFPDMNFATIWYTTDPFDGFSYRRDVARHMDDRYAGEQRYFFLAQDWTRGMTDELIAPNSMKKFYESAWKQYEPYNVGALSVESFARELHSDQYRKRLVNREEAKAIMIDVMNLMKENNPKLLADTANAYAFPFLNDVLNIPIDGSRFVNQSETVPFYGMVTHGFMNIAGTPINMSGDYKYDLLKAIENGANPLFTVSYRNAARIKEEQRMSEYYSVDYNHWLGDILETYKILNENLKPVRAKLIIDHEFLDKNIVKVTYEGGHAFILNYNNNDVTVEGHTLGPLEFVKVS